MKNTILITVLLIYLFSYFEIFPQGKNNQYSTINKININDRYDYIAINQIKMWIGNNGLGSHDPSTTHGAGFYWPGGEDAVRTAAWIDGLMWLGYVDDSLRASGSKYYPSLQAGKILENGQADDPTL